ncbi:LPS export ABC transporter periplasmic protein LptC [Acidimangrovimonas pyrenivorans]|uniref:LPS export ABC transporter periplasmic protein LptC n=1 Tax=Acidimangrovimonas pyrenivorans TaxID=2030798 RepID=A0ABV7ALF3_9RHOB
MARFDNAHSRLVAWLKILLPLAALAILSTLFLFSRTIDPSRAIPFARVDVKELAREPRITGPNYAGVTSDGTAVTLSARTAKPDADNGASATGLHARLDTPDGARTDITAGDGAVDPTAGKMVLEGGVKVISSTGYTIDAAKLTGALGKTDVQSDGPVRASGPLGTLDAGAMHLRQEPGTTAEPGGYVLVFKDGVKLVYQPRD